MDNSRPEDQLETFCKSLVDRHRDLKFARPNIAEVQEPVCVPVILDLTDQSQDSVVLFPLIEQRRLTRKEIEIYRARYTQAPLIYPNNSIQRVPNQASSGWSAYFLELDGHLDLALIDGKPDWMPSIQHGWMLKVLYQNDACLSGRWSWWADQMRAGGFTKDLLPRIEFFENPHPRAAQQLKWALTMIDPKCFEEGNLAGLHNAINYFMDWMLWGLGDPSTPNPPEDQAYGNVFSRLYQGFDAIPFLLYPYNYFGILAASADISEGAENRLIDVADAQKSVRKIFPAKLDHKERTFMSPVIGDLGATTALIASNFTTDIVLGSMPQDTLAVKAALINFYFYAPWAVAPFPWILENRSDVLEDVRFTFEEKAIDRIQAICNGYQAAHEQPYAPIVMLEPRSRFKEIKVDLNRFKLGPSADTPALPEPTPKPPTLPSQRQSAAISAGQEAPVLMPAKRNRQEGNLQLPGQAKFQLPATSETDKAVEFKVQKAKPKKLKLQPTSEPERKQLKSAEPPTEPNS